MKNITCFEIQEKIIDFVLGELTLEDEALIREHVETCPLCQEEFQFFNECIQTCIGEESETCECQFQETYWDDFVVSIHEKICHEKKESNFPYRIVIPIAASAVIAIGVGYFLFFRPSPQETVQEETAPYYQYDPYAEMDELSPEETEEFLKMIQQKYPE
jgi:hypothetical protein